MLFFGLSKRDGNDKVNIMAERKYYRKVFKEPGKKERGVFSALKILLVIFFLGIAGISLLFLFYAKDLPRPEKFAETQFSQSTKIYDREGKVLLYELYGEEKRTIVPLANMPQQIKQAVIAAEDANFYQHFGLDIKGIVRAVLADLKMGNRAQGASTIPQQLIRSALLSREKTLKRKFREAILALELSRRYPKDQILEWYLNQVPFGSNAYGVEAASQTFFNKPVQDISLPEAALLASLIQAPTRYSPYGDDLTNLFARKDYVLDRMAALKMIAKDEAEKAKKEEIKFAKDTQSLKAPHFVMYVRNILLEKYGDDFLKENGLKVYTSLDWQLQEMAEKAVAQGVKDNEQFNAHNAGLVAIDPKTGDILAMVGSKDWFSTSTPKNCTPGVNCSFDPKINIALRPRQPGSAFKPFAYMRAFQKGYTPTTVLWDVRTNFGVWGSSSYIPENYDGLFRGPVTMREALAQSLNVPSVKVLYLAGVQDTIKLAKELGITTLNEPPSFYGLALVLGGGEVKLLDMVSAYGVFAAEGLQVSPTAILRIEDSQGQILEETQKTPKRVLEPEHCRLLNNILSDNAARAPIFGANSPLYIPDYEVAAKTGTTQDYKDAWAIGYTPSLVAGAWAGNNDATSMAQRPAVMLAGSIWNSFMGQALALKPKENFEKPQFVITGKPVLDGVTPGHCILFYVDKDNPRGPAPANPANDPQYTAWEQGIYEWALNVGK